MENTGHQTMKPKKLKKGDTVGIVAPASPANEERIEKSLRAFEQFGFNIKLGASVKQTYGYLSGQDHLRASDLNNMFADSQVNGIICLRGGYGSPRILSMLDYDLIRKNPKVFVGYSDITAIHSAIYKYTGLVTFHGPMVGELDKEQDPYTWPTLMKHLMNADPFGRYLEPNNMFQMTVTPGIAEGRLVGGNLCLLTALIGTPYAIDTTDKILFIEDIGEEPYAIDRMLTQLRLAGMLQAARGIVFTDFSDALSTGDKPSLTIEQVLHDIVAPLGIPCYYGLKAGHCSPNLTLPIGVMARINAEEGWLELIEGSVI